MSAPTRPRRFLPSSNGLLRSRSPLTRRAAGDVRQQLDPPRRHDAGDAAQVAEARRPGALGARHDHPVVLFVERRTEALDVQAPDLLGLALKRSCENGIHISAVQPSRRCVVSRLPDRIEPGVEAVFVVARVKAIEADAGGGHAEDDGGAPIEERVERDQDVLGLVGVVAAAERRLDVGASRADIRAPT